MALAFPKRFRIPPFLPAYTILSLALAYAAVTFSVGSARLDAIAEFTELAAQNTATVQELGALRDAVNDIETGERGFALTADDSYLQPFERGRTRTPELLVTLRDRMRDDPEELALIEQLVPLIAERTLISASSIEQKRRSAETPYEMAFGPRGRESSEAIRAVIANLDVRERDQLAHYRDSLTTTLRDARRDMYAMTGVMLLLVVLLFLAVGRLKAFMPALAGDDSGRTLDLTPADAAGADAGVNGLLRDALLRARLAMITADGSTETSQRRALVATVEQAVNEQSQVESELDRRSDLDKERRDRRTLAQDLSYLTQRYSQPDGLTVRATIDRNVVADNPERAFLIFRSAEWALEAIMLRRRAGEVALHLRTIGDDVLLRVNALADSPQLPLRLTPKEAEEANALRQALAAMGGSFVVKEGPTGFVLTLTVPIRR
jgi:CHASE3 domain sensor protein